MLESYFSTKDPRNHCYLSTVAFSVDEAPEGGREEAVRVKEQSILRLGEVLAKHDFAEGEFLVFLGLVSQARLLASWNCNELSRSQA